MCVLFLHVHYSRNLDMKRWLTYPKKEAGVDTSILAVYARQSTTWIPTAPNLALAAPPTLPKSLVSLLFSVILCSPMHDASAH